MTILERIKIIVENTVSLTDMKFFSKNYPDIYNKGLIKTLFEEKSNE